MPKHKILVINCGSSSLKYEVYKMPEKISLGKGLVERIGLEDGVITQKNGKEEFRKTLPINNHNEALVEVVNALTDDNYGIISDTSEITGVGHRVVHGGEEYSSSIKIANDVIEAIEQNIELAPLHNPANLTGIREAMKIFQNVSHIAVFDTAFHQTIEPSSYLYGLPLEMYEKHRIRRYGFHGTSHRYVSQEAYKMMKRSSDNTNVISCHLGNGASITAIENGRSVDTSMGFTPLEGLIMGTRSGDLDPAIIFYLLERGYKFDEINTILNKKSGILGLSNISSDMRDVEKAAKEGNQNAITALNSYAHRVRKYIGAYAANLIKVDILVFTGGIGENNHLMRERICHRLENLGMVIDDDANRQIGSARGMISKNYSRTAICVIPTNEELQIANDTFDIIK